MHFLPTVGREEKKKLLENISNAYVEWGSRLKSILFVTAHCNFGFMQEGLWLIMDFTKGATESLQAFSEMHSLGSRGGLVTAISGSWEVKEMFVLPLSLGGPTRQAGSPSTRELRDVCIAKYKLPWEGFLLGNLDTAFLWHFPVVLPCFIAIDNIYIMT